MEMRPRDSLTDSWLLLKRGGLKPSQLAVPVALSFAAAGFEGMSLSLLVPLTRGIMTMDFTLAREYAVVRGALALMPHYPPHPKALFTLVLVLIFLCSLLKNALQSLSFLSFARLLRRSIHELRTLVFARYLSFGKIYFDRTSAGQLQTVVMDFTNTIAYKLGELQQMFSWVFLLAVYLALMVSISLKLTLGIILIFPLLNYSLRWLIDRIKRTSQDCAEARSKLGKRVFNILTCLPVVKAYTREREEGEHFARDSDVVRGFELSIDKKNIVVNPLQEMIVLSVLLLLISAVALISAREGPYRLSSLLVYFYLIKRATLAFSVLNAAKATLATISGPVAAVLDVLSDEGKPFVPDGAKEFLGLKGAIEFRSLDYSYAKETPVLKGVSFTARKGQVTALVGPTGAGKSTLINLLMRFYDAPPEALFLDGVDIREFTIRSLRARLALVSQDTMLFNATLRHNISYGLDGKLAEKSLLDAVRKARLEAYVSRLPRGLNTIVGDRGVQLSGGERQRVAIARAILKEADILILDEATSALDTATEKLIQEAIDELVAGKTAIVIAHRLSTIKKADHIVAVEDGRVVETGALQELLERKGRFFQYWEAQKFF